jgi:hypothetical protein
MELAPVQVKIYSKSQPGKPSKVAAGRAYCDAGKEDKETAECVARVVEASNDAQTKDGDGADTVRVDGERSATGPHQLQSRL